MTIFDSIFDGYNFYYWNVFSLILYRLAIRSKKGFLFIACFQFFIVLAIRSIEVGVDSLLQYPVVYAAASKMSFDELLSKWSLFQQIWVSTRFTRFTSFGGESGFVTLNWIFGGLLGLPYRSLLVFLALIAGISIYKFLERNSYSPFLGAIAAYVYLLNCNVYFSAIRRSTAMNFVFFALMAMEDKKFWRALFFLLLATTMHRAAMIMFLFLPFMNVKITRELFRKITLAICVAVMFAPTIASSVLLPLLNSLGKVSYFTEWIARGTRLELKAVVGIVMMFLIYHCLDFSLLNTSYNNMLCKIFLFIIIFSPVQAITPLLTNIHSYFTLPIYLLVSNLIVQQRNYKSIKPMMWMAVFVLLVIVLMRNVEGYRTQPEYNSVFYYRTIWTSHSGD